MKTMLGVIRRYQALSDTINTEKMFFEYCTNNFYLMQHISLKINS